ncbi:YeiH family protein [Natranaerobius thermophilus]|uniref:Uncharacterized protein n=1 Tax=Natranaerobius thermophilus (strain ATCC BAA-1301 / DSM 18059 / JW/NM-WN-LF) TaxID=457570 RepID=B2A160_NATTJ|nr:putative sulfate exporter family transporter [Natranaerobius thermophilus]ACB84680.1 conserved hypothetical protein [Natranaerobius thermophilus JW/NM-WN-LF]
MLRKDDWWAVWLGLFLILITGLGLLTEIPGLEEWTHNPLNSLSLSTVLELTVLGTGLALLTGIAVYYIQGKSFANNYLKAFPWVFMIAVISYVLSEQSLASHYGLGYVVWALALGLFISNVIGVPEFIKPAIKSELFIKTGLVLLGAEILFDRLLVLGIYGIGVAWIVTPIVLVSMYFIGTRLLGINNKSLVVTISAATSVCGVSAAIVTGEASKATEEQMSLAVTITSVMTVLMIIFMPLLITFLGIDPLVGGAWVGGTIDATGAVVVAASVLGQEAVEIAATIKMIQNVLIGVIGFIIAFIWVKNSEGIENLQQEGEKSVSWTKVWTRFPKFIIGFVIASLLFSFVFTPYLGSSWVDSTLDLTSGLRGWFFVLAFVSIGLNARLSRMKYLFEKGNPLKLYLVGQTLNIIATFVMAWILFSGVIFPQPF